MTYMLRKRFGQVKIYDLSNLFPLIFIFHSSSSLLNTKLMLILDDIPNI